MENSHAVALQSRVVNLKVLIKTFWGKKKSTSDWIKFKIIEKDLDNLLKSIRCHNERKVPERVLIIPCDPWTVGGSKGDEAMIWSAVTQIRKTHPNILIGIPTGTDAADQKVRAWGFEALPIWGKYWQLKNIRKAIYQFSPDCLLILGADVLDGCYGELQALKMLTTADLCIRSGIKTILLGFSFNSRPSKRLLSVFRKLDKRILFNLRDIISVKNFENFTQREARLVADIAFLLAPDGNTCSTRTIREWCERRHAEGDLVLAINVHPMLLGEKFRSSLPLFMRAVTEGISSTIKKRKVSVLLVPHDYRGELGDNVYLSEIAIALNGNFPEKVFYPKEQLTAAELKAVAGMVDGIFTGRMHFAIAGFGMETPVMAVTYQDQKFHGLFAHFDMPESLLLLAKDIIEANILAAAIDDFLGKLPTLRRQIQSRLPTVMAAARMNLEGFI
ncbi:polysaccharide pyruvyl transferase family protein [Noviherbaspirillum sp. 1P10PC]|uniref:polysaccharide pyruvyl transferase family protein n=1 Tax=Noviherbaspirillum sp. 1P10PC TaxID=3132292 RepID=UPI0039A04D30